MKIYLAGPVTGNPNYKHDFRAAELRLTGMGYEVVNPARLDLGADATWQDHMRETTRQMTHCEGVALLHGWQHSAGAKIEREWAEKVGLTVLELRHWKRFS